MISARLQPAAEIIQKCVEQLGDRLQNKALTAGLRKSAQPLKDVMRALTPTRTGVLRRSVGHRTLSKSAGSRIGLKSDQRGVLVGPIKAVADPGYARSPGKKVFQQHKAYWLEYGAAAHRIDVSKTNAAPHRRSFTRRKVMKFNGVFSTRVSHPGVRATQYIARANRATGSAQSVAFFNGMAAELDKQRSCST